jgi:hypothetical protein
VKANYSTKVLRNGDGWPARVKLIDSFADGRNDLLKKGMFHKGRKVIKEKLWERLAIENPITRNSTHRFLDHLVENQGDQVRIVGISVVNKIAERSLG